MITIAQTQTQVPTKAAKRAHQKVIKCGQRQKGKGHAQSQIVHVYVYVYVNACMHVFVYAKEHAADCYDTSPD